MTEAIANCVKCDQFAEFVAPDNLCFDHWDEWWTENYSGAELIEHYRECAEQAETDLGFYRKKLVALELQSSCGNTPQGNQA